MGSWRLRSKMKVVLALAVILAAFSVVVNSSEGSDYSLSKNDGMKDVKVRLQRKVLKEKSRSSNEKKGNKKRSKKDKQVKKKKKSKTKKQTIQTKKSGGTKSRQCSATVSDDCLTNAKDVLLWEGYQVKNFLKQYKRYLSFNTTTGNKLGKREKFGPAAGRLANATGNMDNLTCESSSNATRSVTEYKAVQAELESCEATIEAACTRKDPDTVSNVTECNTAFEEITSQKMTTNCINMDSDETAQCKCWKDLADDYMTPLKARKCNSQMTTLVKDMKKAKKACIDAFSQCKKAEDKAPGLVADCMILDKSHDTDAVKIEATFFF